LFLVIPFFPTTPTYLYKISGRFVSSLDSYLPLEDIFLFISQENPLANMEFVLYISMFFHLISSNIKDETTSLKLKVVSFYLWPQQDYSMSLVKSTIN
jgi:hypothetical protein